MKDLKEIGRMVRYCKRHRACVEECPFNALCEKVIDNGPSSNGPCDWTREDIEKIKADIILREIGLRK